MGGWVDGWKLHAVAKHTHVLTHSHAHSHTRTHSLAHAQTLTRTHAHTHSHTRSVLCRAEITRLQQLLDDREAEHEEELHVVTQTHAQETATLRSYGRPVCTRMLIDKKGGLLCLPIVW